MRTGRVQAGAGEKAAQLVDARGVRARNDDLDSRRRIVAGGGRLRGSGGRRGARGFGGTAGAAAPRPCRGPPGAVSSTAPACRPPFGRPWPPGRTAWVSRRPRGRPLSPRTVRRPPRPPWRPPGALLRQQLVDRLHGVGRVGDRDVAALDGVVELGGRPPDRLRALDAAQADIELVRRIGLRNSARWRSFPAAGNPAIRRVFFGTRKCARRNRVRGPCFRPAGAGRGKFGGDGGTLRGRQVAPRQIQRDDERHFSAARSPVFWRGS